jgi:hypothetical protein
LLKLPKNRVTREPIKTTKRNLLEGIGRVIVAHARLELLITELISDLLRIGNPLGRQVYEGHNTVQTFLIVIRLMKVWNLVPSINLGKLKQDIKHAYERRNEVAHGAWFRVKKNDLRLCIMREDRETSVGRLSRRTIPDFKKRRSQDFNGYARRIHSAADRVRDLKKFVRAELKAWERTDPTKVPRGRRPGRGD